MELVFEFIAELLLEGSIEISSNKKISKWIRYPLIVLIILLFSLVIFGLLFFGIVIIKDNLLSGIFIISVFLIMLITGIIKFRKTYLEKSKN